MSWSIRKSAMRPEAQRKLSEAIERAANAHIPMFASLPDEQPLPDDAFWPARLPSVMAVGAATPEGTAIHGSGPGSSEAYYFPGVDVLGGYGEHQEIPAGSSISTALATGLSALLIFCARLLDNDTNRKFNLAELKQMLSSIMKTMPGGVWFPWVYNVFVLPLAQDRVTEDAQARHMIELLMETVARRLLATYH